MTELQDYDLVKEFIAGSEIAFNKIVQKYQNKIYWHARRLLGNHMDADEVTQEVLIVLYNKLHTFNFQSSLFTWIFRIVSTRSLNHIRKGKVKKIFFFEDEDEDKVFRDNQDIVHDLENKEKIEKLDKVMNKLAAKQREVFILRNFEGLSYEEIAKITGRSVGGLKANYFHAIKKVTEMMDEK
jgi:RNA polymerase sigma-70 factor (ECF subfamily)